jgi:arginyl-tRNA synthetase
MVGVVPSYEVMPPSTYLLERLLYRFPEVVADAWEARSPHTVTGFLTELAGAFNSFYATEKIADVNDPYAPYKLALTQAVQTTLKNGLWLLAIEAPERM